jgi:hypothetical protein
VANVYTCGSGTGCAAPAAVATAKVVIGTRTGVGNTATTVTLTGAAVFTSATSYKCTAQNVSGVNDRIYLNQTSGTTFTLTSQGGTNLSVNYICIGN